MSLIIIILIGLLVVAIIFSNWSKIFCKKGLFHSYKYTGQFGVTYQLRICEKCNRRVIEDTH